MSSLDTLLAAGAGLVEDVDWDLLSSYAGLLGLATFSIYAGAKGSLPVHATRIFLLNFGD